MVLSYMLFYISYHEQTKLPWNAEQKCEQLLEDTDELLVVLWSGAINNSVKAGEETTPSVRALKRSAMRFTISPSKGLTIMNMCCVWQKKQNTVSQLRVVPALGLERMDINCSSLCNCTTWMRRRDYSILAIRTLFCQSCWVILPPLESSNSG